jgi:hypothetical protein
MALGRVSVAAMRRVMASLATCAVLPWLGGCGGLDDPAAQNKKSSPFGPTGIPPHLRARGGADPDPFGATAAGLGGGGGGGGGLPGPASGITPEEDIVWTDPDNPDEEIPELDSLLATPARGPWEESESVVRRRAVREGKCILIWFTDSQTSPACKRLSSELFSTPEFDRWAEENLVRLRVDLNARAAASRRQYEDSFDEMDAEARIGEYVEALKKRYRVLGCPTLVMLTPHGEKIENYRGYKAGNGEFVWGQLKSAVIAGEKSYRTWRQRLEKRGYRDWTGRANNLTIFAKLIAYRDGDLLLVEPGGQRVKTNERRLSDSDRLWIEQQKHRR